MHGGIAKVRGDGIPAVRRVNALEVLRHLVKSFVPPETLPTARSAAHGIFQPIFIVVQILQGDGLRADVPAAEWVVFVPADVQTCRLPLPPAPDFNAAYRFAEIAGAVMN
jgi:hypothetical protein